MTNKINIHINSRYFEGEQEFSFWRIWRNKPRGVFLRVDDGNPWHSSFWLLHLICCVSISTPMCGDITISAMASGRALTAQDNTLAGTSAFRPNFWGCTPIWAQKIGVIWGNLGVTPKIWGDFGVTPEIWDFLGFIPKIKNIFWGYSPLNPRKLECFWGYPKKLRWNPKNWGYKSHGSEKSHDTQ